MKVNYRILKKENNIMGIAYNELNGKSSSLVNSCEFLFGRMEHTFILKHSLETLSNNDLPDLFNMKNQYAWDNLKTVDVSDTQMEEWTPEDIVFREIRNVEKAK